MKDMPEIKLKGLKSNENQLGFESNYFAWIWASGKKKEIYNSIGIVASKGGWYRVFHDTNDKDGHYLVKEEKKFRKYDEAVEYLRKLGRRINKKTFQK